MLNEVTAMSKLTIAGIVSFLISALILGFQAISTLMDPSASDLKQQQVAWKKISIVSLFGQEHLEWINTISWTTLQNFTHYVVNMPLYLLLICIGILCFILNAAVSKA